VPAVADRHVGRRAGRAPGERILETAQVAEPLNQATAQHARGRHAAHDPEHGAVVPLKAAETTIGALGLQGDYDDQDLAFFEILAGRVALVLANARLVTDLRSTRRAWTASSARSPRR
jgi:GAF domain-containing protein